VVLAIETPRTRILLAPHPKEIASSCRPVDESARATWMTWADVATAKARTAGKPQKKLIWLNSEVGERRKLDQISVTNAEDGDHVWRPCCDLLLGCVH
jgi:hypothetical protein